MFFEKRRSQKKLYESLIRWDWLVLAWLGLVAASRGESLRSRDPVIDKFLSLQFDGLPIYTHSLSSIASDHQVEESPFKWPTRDCQSLLSRYGI